MRIILLKRKFWDNLDISTKNDQLCKKNYKLGLRLNAKLTL